MIFSLLEKDVIPDFFIRLGIQRHLLLLFFLVHCSMNSADVRKGECLDSAKETSVDDFFEKRMKNRIKKVMGANWEILFESSEFIYFGYPTISFFREGTFLEELFKVNKTMLESEFPVYKNFDGISMKIKCQESVSNYKQSEPGKNFRYIDCKASLDKDYILVYSNLNFELAEKKYKIERYLIRFDKKNLKVESITRLEE